MGKLEKKYQFWKTCGSAALILSIIVGSGSARATDWCDSLLSMTDRVLAQSMHYLTPAAVIERDRPELFAASDRDFAVAAAAHIKTPLKSPRFGNGEINIALRAQYPRTNRVGIWQVETDKLSIGRPDPPAVDAELAGRTAIFRVNQEDPIAFLETWEVRAGRDPRPQEYSRLYVLNDGTVMQFAELKEAIERDRVIESLRSVRVKWQVNSALAQLQKVWLQVSASRKSGWRKADFAVTTRAQRVAPPPANYLFAQALQRNRPGEATPYAVYVVYQRGARASEEGVVYGRLFLIRQGHDFLAPGSVDISDGSLQQIEHPGNLL